MNTSAFNDSTNPDSATTLYESSPPSISAIWRLQFIDQREASPHDLFALLRYVDLYVEIVIVTVLRTWNDGTPVYWVRFEDAMQALVTRGFATNAEGPHSVKVTGALVSLDLFRLAEEEEYNPRITPPLTTNRWDYPLQSHRVPSPHNHTKSPGQSDADHQQVAPRRPLQERIQHATLLEHIALN